jgi:hypothetical protein
MNQGSTASARTDDRRPTTFTRTTRMQTSTWITMAVIMGVIWGGFAVLLVTALRKESAKGERQGSGAEE